MALPAFIKAQAEAVAALHAALKAEREALVDSDPVALENASHDKLVAARQLEALESERRQLCEAVNAGTDEAAFVALLDPEQRAYWAGLKDEAAACREQNVANGHLLSVKTRQVAASLNILRGVEGGSAIYGPDGQCSGHEARRSLVSA